MNPNHLPRLASALLLAASLVAHAALPAAWQKVQSFEITTPGLVKISLPPETLDAARPALADLRLYDAVGNEQPYLIEHPTPPSKAVQNAKSFQVSLNASTTVITLETGLAQPLEGVTLESPAGNFIKAVRVEGSTDGKRWHLLAQGLPIFRQSYGASQLHLPLTAGVWPWLRLTVDDQRSSAIPITGARIHAATAEVLPNISQATVIAERNENPGQTRLTLNLGAANLEVTAVKIETDEPLFTRTVTFAVPTMTERGLTEQIIGQGTIYRVAVEGQPTAACLTVPLPARINSRELVMLIQNNDSPPLSVSAVQIERRPVYLVFLARSTGTFQLLAGNKSCPPAHYDLAALGANLKSVPPAAVTLSAPADNPDYHAPEALTGIELTGAPLDPAGWKFRKPLPLARSGVQQVELDLDVLAQASAGLTDLRVMRGSNQVPYLIQRTSISRAITPTVIATNDVKRPHTSRWLIRLPQANLPLTRLTCTAKSPLFQRSLSLAVETTDERGSLYLQPLSSATWIQTPERKSKEFSLSLEGMVPGATLWLETDNGDNPPLELENFSAFYPATRILFKARPEDHLLLYYGNPRSAAPSYDLNLVAAQLLAADKSIATLGAEEQLTKSAWPAKALPDSGGFVFWGILALVVISLLAVIARLLPKPTPPKT